MKTYFIDKKFVLENEAKVSVNDLGFLRGFGVFDLAAIYCGKVFLEDEHLQRLQNSAQILGLKLPFSIAEMKNISINLIAKNKSKNALIRWILTGGVSTHFVEQETFAVLIEDEPNLPEQYFELGVSAITTSLKREIPEAKTLNYQIAYSNYPKMEKVGAYELIYTPENTVLEATTSNVFLVKGGKVYTPKVDILLGITREKVIKLCKKNDLAIFEGQIKKTELELANEVFITATTKKIMPVTKIDNKAVGNGKVGPVTSRLMKLFDGYIEKSLK